MGTKIREKTFSIRIVAAYPASACVPKGFTTACTIIIPIATVGHFRRIVVFDLLLSDATL